jgi:HEPN domain-containing protein
MEISKTELQSLSMLRLEEAKLLFQNGKYSGAYYLAGYSIEFALKACIASNFRSGFIPDKSFVNELYTHNLDKLIGLAGLREELTKETKANSIFAGYWGVVKDWSEQVRYSISDVVTATALLSAISDPNNGVLRWLKKYY